MAIYKSDIVDINLETGSIHRSFIKHTIGTADENADRFGVRVFRNGEAVDLSGCSCYGYFQNSNGDNIALTSAGTVDGNVAYVTLPQACYNYEGNFCLAIKLLISGVTSTVRIVDGVVDNTNTGSAVAPTDAVPSYSEILDQYDAMVAATAVANGAIATTFNAATVYPAGSYVINSGALYRITADHAANVTWANTSKVATNFGAEVTGLKSALSNIEKIQGESEVGVSDFNQPQSGLTYTTDTENGTITITNGSTGSYACLQTANTWGGLNLIPGRTYRLHAKAVKESGSPNVRVAIRGVNGNADGVAVSANLNDSGEGFVDFVATAYMKRVSLFMSFGSSTKNSVATFSEIWVKEYNTIGVDYTAREDIGSISGRMSNYVTSKNMFSGEGEMSGKYIKTRTVGSAIGYDTSTGANSYDKTIKINKDVYYTLSSSSDNNSRHFVLVDDNGIVLQAVEANMNSGSVVLKFDYNGWLCFDYSKNATQFMIEYGKTPSTYSDYDGNTYGVTANEAKTRVIPYDGYADLLNTSENILNGLTAKYGIYIVGGSIGSEISYATSSSAKVYKKCALIRANTDYTLSFESEQTTGNGWKIVLCDSEEIKLAEYDYAITARTATFKYSSDCYIYLQVHQDATDIMLNEGKTAETYVAYDGQTYGISTNRTKKAVQPKKDSYIAFLPSMTVKSIAHRGDDIDAPQNTAPAYIMARKNGLRIAENDVFNSSDNEFVMWHDPTLYRLGNMVDINGYLMYVDGSNNAYWYDSEHSQLYTYEDGEYVESSVSIETLTQANGSNYSVTDLPYATLKRIDFGRWKASKFKGTQILSFEEWVILCKQLGMELYIDHKTNLNATMIQTLVGIVKKWGMLDKASWICNETQAAYLRNNDPNARIVVLQNPTSSNVETWRQYVGTGRGIAFDGDASGLTQNAVQLGIENGYEVECYYVDFNDEEPEALANIRTLINMGITGITTDKYSAEWAFEYLLEQY